MLLILSLLIAQPVDVSYQARYEKQKQAFQACEQVLDRQEVEIKLLSESKKKFFDENAKLELQLKDSEKRVDLIEQVYDRWYKKFWFVFPVAFSLGVVTTAAIVKKDD